jgi:hypothetical protein
MIDLTRESLISLSDVPAHLPERRGGKRPHISCIYRWAQKGCRGVLLETLQCGGTKITSLQALQRFFEKLTAASSGTAPPTRSSRQRERDIAMAEADLSRAGM